MLDTLTRALSDLTQRLFAVLAAIWLLVLLPVGFLSLPGPRVPTARWLPTPPVLQAEISIDPGLFERAAPAPAAGSAGGGEEPEVAPLVASRASAAGARRVQRGDGSWASGNPGPVRRSAAPRGGGRCPSEYPEVRARGALEYEVDRAWARSLVDDHAAAARLAQVVRYGGGGGEPGYLISRLGCKSPLYGGGLRQGDLVHRVNGQPLHGPAGALRAIRKLQNERVLRLEITRAGEPLVLRYHMV